MKLRTEKILHTLLFSQKPVPVEEFAKEHGVSVRTVQNDISEINILLNSHSFDEIKSLRNKGLFLELSKKEEKEIYELLEKGKEHQTIYLNKTIRIFHLVLEIALGDSFFIYEKEEEFGVSKSALDSDIRNLRKLLKSYDLELKSDLTYGLKLVGAESNIRIMLFDQIFENLETMDILEESKYLLSEYQVLFKFIPLEFISKINHLYDLSYTDKANYLYKDQLLIIVSIWILRNNKLTCRNKLYKESHDSNTKLFIEKIVTEFELEPNDAETKDISLIMDALSHSVLIGPKDWMEVQILTIDLISHLQQAFIYLFDDESEELFKKLFEHNLRLHSRIRKNIQLYNPLTEDIKKDHSEIFRLTKDFFEKRLGSKVTEIKDDEIAFIVIHFLAAEYRKEPIKRNIHKAVIFCNYGLATGVLLADNLQKNFPVEIVATLNMNEIYLLDKLDYDVIFSTRRMNIKEAPYLVVEPILDDKDKQNIEEFLNKNPSHTRFYSDKPEDENKLIFTEIIETIEAEYGSLNSGFIDKIIDVFRKNQLNIEEKEIQPMIKDVLSEDKILLNAEVESWKEAIAESASPLLNADIIENRYVEAMIDVVEEHGPYIILGEGLALAHAGQDDGVNELGLSVATFNPPVDFGGENAKNIDIVFCLAAVDSYSHLKIIKSLIDLSEDKTTLSKLKKCTDKDEFKSILTRDE